MRNVLLAAMDFCKSHLIINPSFNSTYALKGCSCGVSLGTGLGPCSIYCCLMVSLPTKIPFQTAGCVLRSLQPYLPLSSKSNQ